VIETLAGPPNGRAIFYLDVTATNHQEGDAVLTVE
jgi:hypothetical protein